MVERRALIEGLKPQTPPVDPKQEEAFVYGTKRAAVPAEPVSIPVPRRTARVQLSTKLRADLAEALKQASLKRQLSGEEPSKVQEILEAALEPWLRTNGYLT